MKVSLYNKYLELKKENSNNLYLFKKRLFYIFLDNDAVNISKITTLKLTNHTNDIVKCGFPEQSLNKYMNIFNNLGLNIILIEEVNNNKLEKYLNKIKNIDINIITPIESINILSELKKLLE